MSGEQKMGLALPQLNVTAPVSTEFSAPGREDGAVPKQWSIWRRFSVAFAIYIFAVGIRFWGIGSLDPQPDEHHWLERMHKMIYRIEAGDYWRYNTHLGHPGAPAVLVMYGANRFTHWFNEDFLRVQSDNKYYLDELTAVRGANTLVSSLIFPLLFLSTAFILSPAVALLGTALFALSPAHIGLSRLAHLDTMLTLFVTGALISFFASEKRQSVKLKILAGVFWGLAIATKPTAGFLIPGLLLAKLARNIILRTPRLFSNLFSWSDVWAVVTGHLVLAALYSRLWQTNSRYVVVYHMHNAVTELFALARNPALVTKGVLLGLLVLGTVATWKLIRNRSKLAKRRGFGFHLQMIWSLLGLLTLFLIFNPNVPQNVTRFWIWAAGLSHAKHYVYGLDWQPPRYGYLQLLFTKVPVVVLIGLCLGVVALTKNFIESRFGRAREKLEQQAFLVSLIICFLTWIALLSISSKQTFRYAMPVLPGLYLLSAYGYWKVFSLLLERASSGHPRNRLVPQQPPVAFACGIVAIQALFTIVWQHSILHYENLFSGGIQAELDAGRPVPVYGTSRVVDFFNRAVEEKKREIVVMTLGDIDILYYTAEREQVKNRKLIKYLPFKNFSTGDYLLIFPGFFKRASELIGRDVAELEEVFAAKIDGTSVMKVYRIPPPDYVEPVEFSTRRAPRQVGNVVHRVATGEFVSVANPGEYPPGYLIFGIHPVLPPGVFHVAYQLALPANWKAPAGIDPDVGVVRVELGDCRRIVELRELKPGVFTDITFTCGVAEEVLSQICVYWFGAVPIEGKDFMVRRASVTDFSPIKPLPNDSTKSAR